MLSWAAHSGQPMMGVAIWPACGSVRLHPRLLMSLCELCCACAGCLLPPTIYPRARSALWQTRRQQQPSWQ